MPKKEFILSNELLTDGADTVLKATFVQERRLRDKIIYVYTRNLDDINTDFGEIDPNITSASSAACGLQCQEQVRNVKRASAKKKILEEGPVGQQITPEQLADLNAGMLAIEAEDDQLDNLFGALSVGGKRKRMITNKRCKTNKRRRTNKRCKTNKRRRTNKRR